MAAPTRWRRSPRNTTQWAARGPATACAWDRHTWTAFSVPVGYEVDITLDSAPDSYGWQVGMQVVLSSDAATVIDVLIPAGPVNPAGPTYLYRIKALSPGQVVVQIPRTSVTSDAGQRAYEITLNIS